MPGGGGGEGMGTLGIDWAIIPQSISCLLLKNYRAT